MKIIKNNYKPLEQNDEKDNQIECGACHSIFEFEDSDIEYGSYGIASVCCPCCGESYELDEYSLELTIDNLDFPKHFGHFSKEECVCVSNDMIISWIKNGVRHLRQNPDEPYYCVGSGDSLIVVFRLKDDEEYFIVVGKDFYETSIPFEDIDFEQFCN